MGNVNGSGGVGFSMVLHYLEGGYKVARSGWNGKGMWVRLIDLYSDKEFKVVESKDSQGTWISFMVMKTVDNKLVPWQPSQTDMRSQDWIIVE